MDTVTRTLENPKQALGIAQNLPDHFTAKAFREIKSALQSAEAHSFGAYYNNKLVGFVIYTQIKPQTVEMSWLAESLQRD